MERSHLDAAITRTGVTSKLPKAQAWTDPEVPRDLKIWGQHITPAAKEARRSLMASKETQPQQGLPFGTERNILESVLPLGKLPTQNGDF